MCVFACFLHCPYDTFGTTMSFVHRRHIHVYVLNVFQCNNSVSYDVLQSMIPGPMLTSGKINIIPLWSRYTFNFSHRGCRRLSLILKWCLETTCPDIMLITLAISYLLMVMKNCSHCSSLSIQYIDINVLFVNIMCGIVNRWLYSVILVSWTEYLANCDLHANFRMRNPAPIWSWCTNNYYHTSCNRMFLVY